MTHIIVQLSGTLSSSLVKHLSKVLVFLPFFILSIAQIFGQETNCSNGVDDDANGFVDCYDPNCSGNAACTKFFFGNNATCTQTPDIPQFAVTVQWRSADTTANSHASPLVGDLDQDGVPEVVVNNRQSRTVTILNGENGTTYASKTLAWAPENVMAIANVTRGNCAYILVYEDQGDNLIMLDCNLRTIWEGGQNNVPMAPEAAIGNPAFADFNQDGTPELYHKNEIRNAATGAVLVDGHGQLATGETWLSNIVEATVAIDILDDDACVDCAGLELAAGRFIYSVSIDSMRLTAVKDINDYIRINPANENKYFPKKSGTSNQHSGVSVADYDQDGFTDILMSGALGTDHTGPTTIFFWNVKKDSVFTYTDVSNDHAKGTGRLNIADVDNDGQMNVNYVSNDKLYSLDENMQPQWTKTISESSSGFTGCTLFDFDDDGTIETVYRSQTKLLIIDGRDGSTRVEKTCISRTQEEYPIVADVDGDGASEICVTCYTDDAASFNPYDNSKFSQVRVYQAGEGESWQPSRSVWNQSSYFNVNVNDDLTIPRQQQDHAVVFSNGECTTKENRALNSFMVQAPILNQNGCSNYVTPDLSLGSDIEISNLSCPNTLISIAFSIKNVGDVAVSGTIPVTFYNGDPFVAGSSMLNTINVTFTNLDIRGTVRVDDFVSGPSGGGDFTLFVVINDAGATPPITFSPASISECGNETNNVGSISVVAEPFEFTVMKVRDNRKCSPGGDSLPDNGEARAFFTVTEPRIKTIYLETFDDLPIGTISDDGSSTTPPTAWSRVAPAADADDYAEVRANGGTQMFKVKDSDADVTWTSDTIDISRYSNVKISADMFAEGDMEVSGAEMDYVHIRYILDGQPAAELDNGRGEGNFGYQSATVSKLTGSTLAVQVIMHNTEDSEFYYLDNVNIQGFLPSTQDLTENDDLYFSWYEDTPLTTDLTNPIHSGSTYPAMSAGTYVVEAVYLTVNCISKYAYVTINADNSPNFSVHAREVSPLTNCASSNGEVTAFAYTFESSPGVPGDTLTDGYTFKWKLTADAVTTLGTAPTLSNLDANQYRVKVKETLTGCKSAFDVDVTTRLIDSNDIEIVATPTDITTCGGGTGEASVFVDDDPSAGVTPNTTDYTFEWFIGTQTKATPDFTGVTYTNLNSGAYTVVATQLSSSCSANPVTIAVRNSAVDPTPTSTSTDNTTCATTGVGSIIVDPDGTAGSADPADYAYEWFVGTNALPNNQLPAALAGAAFGTVGQWEMTGLRSNTYTILVTETVTGCTTTIRASITDNVMPLTFTSNSIIGSNNTSCDAANGNGSVDVSTYISSASTYTYKLFDGFSTTVELQSNSTGLFTGLSSGSYTITAQDDITQCTTSPSTVSISDRLNSPTITTTVTDDSSCNGATTFTGSIAVTSSSNTNTSRYTYELFDGASLLTLLSSQTNVVGSTGVTFNGLENGTYRVQVTNEVLVCKAFMDVQVGDAVAIPVFTAGSPSVINNSSCTTIPNGGVTVQIDGESVSNYTFSWYNGEVVGTDLRPTDVTNSIDSLAAGKYTVVATHKTTKCATIQVTGEIFDQPDLPNITIENISSQTDCGTGNGNGSANAFVSAPGTGGFGCNPCVEANGFSFQWFVGSGTGGAQVSTGQGGNTSEVTSLAAGTYTVEVTDPLNCKNTKGMIIAFSQINPTLTQDGIATANTTCDPSRFNGSVTVKVEFNGENPVTDLSGYTFDWYNGSGAGRVLNTSSITETLSNVQDGVYSVAVNAPNVCTSASIVVTVPAALPVIVANESGLTNNTVCNPANNGTHPDSNGGINFTPTTSTGATTGFTYTFALRTSGQTTIDGTGSTAGFSDVRYATNTPSSRVRGLPAGNYIMSISNQANSCNTDFSFAIADEVTDLPVINQATLQAATIDNTTCSSSVYTGQANATSHVTGGSGSYIFSWATAAASGVEIDNDNLLDDDANNNTGVIEGDYILTVTDEETGCVGATADITIGNSTPIFTIDASVINIDYTCDPANPSGSVRAEVNGGSTGYMLEWYAGTSATGTSINSTTNTPNTISNQRPGSYTVKVTHNASTCFQTETIRIIEDTPIIGLSVTNTIDQSSCNAANGLATATPSITFSGGSPAGFTPVYTYVWHRGQSATSGNGIANQTTSTLANLAAGYYTVVATEANTGCSSSSQTVQIMDSTPAPPTIEIVAGAIPAACNAVGGSISATISGGTGPFFYFWYEGSDDFANDDPTGSAALASNSNLVASPNPAVTVTTTPTITLGNIVSGLYTLVVKDGRGCRYQETFDLPFNGIQTAAALTVTNISQCPDNGSVGISLADNQVVTVISITLPPSSSNFITLEPYTSTGTAPATGLISFDDLAGTVHLSVASGSLNVGDQITGTISSTTATINSVSNQGYANDAVDDIDEYIVYLYAGAGVPANRTAPYQVTNLSGTQLTFPYTFDPDDGRVLDGNQVLVENAGVISQGDTAIFTNLPAGPYTAIAREKVNAAFTAGGLQCWSTSATDILIQEAYKPIIGSAIITNDTECNTGAGNGSIDITGKLDVGDITQIGNFQFSLFDTLMTPLSNSGNQSNTLTTTFTNLDAGTYLVTVTRLGLAGPLTNSCDTTARYIVPEDPEVHEITNASIVPNDDCSPLNGSITITDAHITDNVADYTFTWWEDAARNISLGTTVSATFNSARNEVSNLSPGTYYVSAEHSTKGCTTPLFEAIVDDQRAYPIVQVTSTLADASCNNTSATGEATVNVIMGGVVQTTTDYSFTWYSDQARTLSIPDANISGGLNNGAPGANLATGLQDGVYYVVVQDITNAVGCQNAPSATVTIVPFNPTYSVGTRATTDFNITHVGDCDPINGAYEILQITESQREGTLTTTTPLTDFIFTWYDNPALGASDQIDNRNVTGGTNGVAGASGVDNLDAGTYYVTISSVSTGCPTTGNQVHEFTLNDTSEDPQIAFVSSTASTFCNVASPNDGNGTLSINILEGGLDQNPPNNYTITWYRGNSTVGTNEIFPMDQGGLRETANISIDGTELTGLSQGFYTVTVNKTTGNSPGLGCMAEMVFEVTQVEDIPTLDEAAINAAKVNNTSCSSSSPNGSITITDADISAGDLTDFSITIEKTSVGSGDIRLTATNPTASALTATSLEVGEYMVSAQNSTTGCEAAAVRINIEGQNFPPNIQLVDLIDNLNCTGGNKRVGSITVTADEFDETNADYNFQWHTGSSTGSSPIVGETNASLENFAAGTYTVSVNNIITGCSSTQEFTISDVSDGPVIINYEINNQTVCTNNGSFAIVDVLQSGRVLDRTAMDAEGYTLEVFTKVGNTSQGTAVASPYTIENLAIDNYYAIVTNNGSNCPSDTVDFEVADDIMYPVLNLTVTQKDDPCSLANGEMTVTADGEDDTNTNYTFTWYAHDNGVRGAMITTESTLSEQVGGLYEVEVTHTATQCTTSVIGELFQNDPIDPLIGSVTVADATICDPPDGAITVDAINLDTPQEYVFDLYDESPDNVGATPIATLPAGTNPVLFNGLAAGVYYLLATHDTRKCGTPTAFEVVIKTSPDPPVIDFVDFIPNTRCDPTNANGSITAEADGSTDTDPVTGYTWTWTGVDEFGVPVVGLPNNATIEKLPAGTYKLTVTNNATGCLTAALPYVLTNESPAPLNISVSTAGNTNCINFNGKMAATVIQPIYTLDEYDYLWYDGTVANPDLNNPDYTGSLIEDLENGSYTLVVRDTPGINDICESAVIQVIIEDERNVDFMPIVDVVQDVTFCYANLANGHAEITNVDLGQYSIEWFGVADVVTSIQTGFFVDSLTVGNYQVKMTNLISGCEYTSDFAVIDATEVIPNPSVTLISENTDCIVPNGEAVATINGATQDFQFDWFDASDTELITILLTGSHPTDLVKGSYIVRATHQITGCISGTTPITIQQIITDPLFEIVTANSLCLRTEDGAINQFSGDAYVRFSSFNFVDSAAWFDENGVRLTYNTTGEPITDGAVGELIPGTYRVDFRANNGCDYSATFSISTAVEVFNFVTANGDTRNDFFLIDCLDFYPKNNVQIFTRAGQKVFEVNAYDNFTKRFDGTSKRGEPLPSGTYFYVIDKGDGSELIQGYLELVR